MKDNPFLSVVIPAYNEEHRIIPSINKIIEYLKGRYSYEIIVVDDGSKDKTVDLIASSFPGNVVTLLKNNSNRGKGYSVKHGMLHAKGDYVLFSDADLSTPITELEKLINPLKDGYDFAFGSRSAFKYKLEKRKIKRVGLMRVFLGKCLHYILRPIFISDQPIDTQCGFKCFTRKAAQEIFSLQKIDGGMFDVEIIYIARKLSYRIIEVPVEWYDCPGSTINVMKCVIFDPFDVAKIKINGLLGNYTKRH